MGSMVQTLLQDLRYAIRMLAKSPNFTAVAILTLALGIGANTALFSVINGVLLSPLPFPEPDRLVSLYTNRLHFERASISYPNFLDWQRQQTSFTSIAAFRRDDFRLTGSGEAEHLRGQMVSAPFFSILGLQPLKGRWFTPEEDRLGGAPVVIISAGLWKRKFASAENIVNGRVTLNGVDYTIVGVLPSSFHLQLVSFSDSSEVFVPIGQWTDPVFYDRGSGMGMKAIGRLKPGVTLEQARADMDARAARLAQAYPVQDKDSGITTMSMKESMVHDIRPFLLVLMGAVAFVLLIACVNVANLSLARSLGRSKEFAIRSALGAGMKRVVRQLLTESILLAAAGGALGLFLAVWATQAGLSLLSDSLPRVQDITLDSRVLLFTIVISVLSGVLFGLAPALRMMRADVQETLKQGGRGIVAGRHRAQGVFVAVELAMAVVLLIGAGLMLRTMSRLWDVSPGFDPKHILTFYVGMPPAMDKSSPDAIRESMLELHRRIAAVPGVHSVSMLRGAQPMRDDSEDPFWIEGRPKPQSTGDLYWSIWSEVEPDYLKVMGIPLLRGRFFTPQDTASSSKVAVVDEYFVNRFFPGEDPLGKYFVDEYLGPTQIVGVVGHVKQWGLDDKAAIREEFYIPFQQIPDKYLQRATRNTTVVVRLSGDPLAFSDTIRREIQELNSEIVMFTPMAMDDVVYNQSILPQRFSMTLLGVFAAVALLLASVGIYGVLSYIVGQRSREIGIRIALGARRTHVLRWVMAAGARMALIGIAVGVAAAFGLTRLMAGLLYGVSAIDPLTFATVAAILLVVALAACYIPAWRAMRVDPIVVMRQD
jgi:predicted permease